MAKWKLLGILGALALVGSSMASKQETTPILIAPGTMVAGIEVGGLTRDDAAKKLETDLAERLQTPVNLVLNNRHWQATREDLGLSLDASRMISTALTPSDPGKPKWTPLSFNLDREKARQYLETHLAPVLKKPGKNARLVDQDGNLVIVHGQYGVQLDVNAAVAHLSERPNTETLHLTLVPAPPAISDNDLAGINKRIGHYESHFRPWVRGRTHNIRLATGLIDGTLLRPGETFSFNGVVGERTAARGFKAAHIFIKDEVVEGLGGGMCQVSSTIYNAALLADMNIVERHPHMFLIDYVPPGQDAAVAYGQKDFKFKNNSSKPIYITLKAGENTLVATFYSSQPVGREIRIKSVHRRGPGRITYAQVYREVVENGEIHNKTLLNRNAYPPQPKVSSKSRVRT